MNFVCHLEHVVRFGFCLVSVVLLSDALGVNDDKELRLFWTPHRVMMTRRKRGTARRSRNSVVVFDNEPCGTERSA